MRGTETTRPPRTLHRGKGYHTHTGPGCYRCQVEDEAPLRLQQPGPGEEMIGQIETSPRRRLRLTQREQAARESRVAGTPMRAW